jgi:CubicO group peptidase (beta-lactamase class C family)
VAAQYFRDLAPGEAVNMKSASKSVLSLLVGIALEEGHLDSLRQPIGPFFPEILEGAPRKQQITLRDLLTMRAGLESTSFGNYGAWVTSDNWVRDALERPLIRPPGQGEMIYSTGTSHLVAVILAKAVGRPLRAYAQAKLFDPLGVTIRSWQQDPQGYYFGGNNMALTPTALLRVGRLIAQEGRFQGRQVIPADWIERATRTYVTKTYRDFKYGYFWWIENFAARRVVFAWGYGGQFVFIVPEIDLVIACTSSLTNRPPGTGDHTGRVFRMLEDAVLPAVQAPVGGGVR